MRGVLNSQGHTAALLAIGSWSSVMETIEARWPNSALQAASASCQFLVSLKILHTCSVPQSNQSVFPLPVSAENRIHHSVVVFRLENISQSRDRFYAQHFTELWHSEYFDTRCCIEYCICISQCVYMCAYVCIIYFFLLILVIYCCHLVGSSTNL